MADFLPINIRANETGVIRIFAMDMPAQQARFQNDPIALQQVLGVTDIDPAYVEIFPVSDLGQLGLAGYLVEGCGIPAGLVELEQDQLNAVTGYVLLLHSRAFDGRAVTLTPTLSLIATFIDPGTDWSGTKIETQSAKLFTSKRPPPRQTRSAARRSGAMVFTVFMLIVAAIILMVVL